MNPRIGSGLQYIRRLQEEKAVEEVQNLRGGTRKGARNAFPKGNRETGTWEWTPAVQNDGGAIFGNPKRQSDEKSFDGRDTKASGKTARRAEGGSRRLSTVCGIS